MCAVVGAVLNLPDAQTVRMAEGVLAAICSRSTERGRDGRGLRSTSWTSLHQLPIEMEVKSTTRFDDGLPMGFPRDILQVAHSALVVCNFRAEPTTEYVEHKRRDDQQPYAAGPWAVVHNGTIANDKELRNYSIHTQIDSAAIPEALHEADVHDFEGFISVIRRLKGSYAILASNTNIPHKLFAATNYRPLWYINTDAGTFIASSETYFPEGTSPKMVEPYTAVEFSLVGRENYIRTVSLRRPLQAPRALVVCSGGLDSVVAATQAQRGLGYDISLVHFQYGCRAQNREQQAIGAVALDLGVPLQFVNLPIWDPKSSPLFDKDSKIAGGEAGAEFAHEWVPARNLVMLAVATSLAESQGFDYIVLGNNLEEAGAYPDNEPEFINKFNKMLPFAVGDGKRVEVLMPVGNLMKHEIVRLGLELKAPMHLTWSCYRQGEKHCGTCGPCFMRKKAFEINGSTDPVM